MSYGKQYFSSQFSWCLHLAAIRSLSFSFETMGHSTFTISVHPTIQSSFLQSFQKEITLNTERIDGLIVFGEGLIQKSSPQDAALIEHELEDLHSYCQEVFSRLVRFHQRLSQPPVSWRTHTYTASILPFIT